MIKCCWPITGKRNKAKVVQVGTVVLSRMPSKSECMCKKLWPPFCRWHFCIYLPKWKFCILISISLSMFVRDNWGLINIGSGNGLVPSGSKPLPEPMMTKINLLCPSDVIWHHRSESTLDQVMAIQCQAINSLRPSDAICRHISESTLAQVMACCLTAPSHYMNQCWLIISKV